MVIEKNRLVIEGALVLLVSAALTPIGVYWLSNDPGTMLLMVHYPWNITGIILAPAAVAAIAAFVIARFIKNKNAFRAVFRPAFYICWGFDSIRFLVIMAMT